MLQELSHKFKFQQLVLAHFIPEAVLHKIESNAEYDPVREEWLLIRLNFAGNVLRARYPEKYASTKEGSAAADMMQQQAIRNQVRRPLLGGRGWALGQWDYHVFKP